MFKKNTQKRPLKTPCKQCARLVFRGHTTQDKTTAIEVDATPQPQGNWVAFYSPNFDGFLRLAPATEHVPESVNRYRDHVCEVER